MHDSFKLFKEQCKLFIGIRTFQSCAPDTDKVSPFLKWLGPKSYGILNHPVFPDGKSKTVYKDVVDQFTLYFKPTQSIIQSRYQLGYLTSALCKIQTEFLNRLLDIASEFAFSNKDEVAKFLFMIHNANTRIKDELIKSMKPESMQQDIIAFVKICQEYNHY